ncbi:MAG: hypothetical protein Q9208_003246 [Pyrenodesmia sp. 3 TL-2023]
MKISNILLPLVGLVAIGSATSVPAERQVMITYPDGTHESVLQQAKEAIVAAGGKVTKEYTLIKAFAATVSSEVLDTLSTLSGTHKPLVEDDGVVTIQQQEPIGQ